MAIFPTGSTPAVIATYTSTFTNLTLAALATDFVILNGSATKTVSVIEVVITGVATTAANYPILLVKRSSANTGGTPSTPAVCPFDSNDPAATAVLTTYAGVPTIGGQVGQVKAFRMFFPAPASVAAGAVITWSFGTPIVQPIVLHGVAEGLAISLSGVTITGGSVCGAITWTEV